MFHHLSQNNDIDILANFYFAPIDDIVIYQRDNVKEIAVPHDIINNKVHLLNSLIDIIVSLNVDILHIWGTENNWGKLLLDYRLKDFRKLLEIQGLKFFLQKKEIFYGGIQENKIKKMIGIKELIYPRSRLYNIRCSYEMGIQDELNVINQYKYIDTQSDWVRTLLKLQFPDKCYFNTDIILRDSFISSSEWYKEHRYNESPIIFTTTSSIPYKGLHFLLSVMRLIVKRFPSVKLRVAGISIKKKTYKNSAYVNYLLYLIKRWNLADNVTFLGNLNEYELKSEMYKADVYVCPSYSESYSLALAEALAIGLPSISAFTSALPELIRDGIDGYLYPMNDEYICADRILKIIKNPEQQIRFSQSSSIKIRQRINPTAIANNQVKIYQTIVCGK